MTEVRHASLRTKFSQNCKLLVSGNETDSDSVSVLFLSF